MARKQDKAPSKKKEKYRISNWREYNRSLVNRGMPKIYKVVA